ncbi:MAG TPA: DNA adenine methylase [Gaiellales bacterium]|nr:DNA adenine methylase [Gaiellales bacterium]
MIKYLGSKRLLVPAIGAIARALPVRSAADLFAGTTRVGQELRGAGLEVVSNDTTAYSEAFGWAYVAATLDDRSRLGDLLRELERAPELDGYVTATFCRRARYLTEENGRRVDGMRAAVDRLDLSPAERGLLLTSLIEAADRVDSTVGVQMAYLKRWAPRAHRPLELRPPHAVGGPPGTVRRADANELVGELEGIDCAYLDPPYNQHSYLGNYHVWETLALADEPPHYGVACKRIDVRDRRSAYNSRVGAWPALRDLVERAPMPWLIVSFSDEGFHDPAAVRALLGERGYVGELRAGGARYVGARIGIHDPRGRRVGEVSHLENTEHLFVAGPSRPAISRALESARPLLAPVPRTDSRRSRSSGRRAASAAAGAASATRGRARGR